MALASSLPFFGPLPPQSSGPTDPFGPLAMMVVDTDPERSARSTLGTVSRPGLPVNLHPQARLFQQEWLDERISKSALAEAIEACLRQSGQPVPAVSGRWHRIRPTDRP
jgi:hypothetical protein